MRPGKQLLLLGGVAGWSFQGAGLDLDFLHGRAALRGRAASLGPLLANTNSSGGYAKWSDGHLSLIPASTPRLSDLGLLCEQNSTNLALRSNDLTNAAWTKSSTTAALDQVGPDLGVNSASSLTATGANGTVLQAITHASATVTVSFFIKRITGSGTISITTDGGTSYLDVTANINSATYTQVSKAQAAVTNPSIGIKLGTNGDKIAVWCGQLEVLGAATSPIVTAGASATRQADVVTVSAAAFAAAFQSFPHSLYARGLAPGQSVSATLAGLHDGTANNRSQLRMSSANQATLLTTAAGTGIANLAAAGTPAAGVSTAMAAAAASTDYAIARDGGTVATAATAGAMPSGLTTGMIGVEASNANPWNQIVQRAAFFQRRLSNAQLQALSAL